MESRLLFPFFILLSCMYFLFVSQWSFHLCLNNFMWYFLKQVHFYKWSEAIHISHVYEMWTISQCVNINLWVYNNISICIHFALWNNIWEGHICTSCQNSFIMRQLKLSHKLTPPPLLPKFTCNHFRANSWIEF